MSGNKRRVMSWKPPLQRLVDTFFKVLQQRAGNLMRHPSLAPLPNIDQTLLESLQPSQSIKCDEWSRENRLLYWHGWMFHFAIVIIVSAALFFTTNTRGFLSSSLIHNSRRNNFQSRVADSLLRAAQPSGRLDPFKRGARPRRTRLLWPGRREICQPLELSALSKDMKVSNWVGCYYKRRGSLIHVKMLTCNY